MALNFSSLNLKTGVGEHTRLGCGWMRLASSLLLRFPGQKIWNHLVRSKFSARARKTARAARALPIMTSVFGLNPAAMVMACRARHRSDLIAIWNRHVTGPRDISGLPAAMHPKPIGRVGPHGVFQG